jgi:hypothetical protein
MYIICQRLVISCIKVGRSNIIRHVGTSNHMDTVSSIQSLRPHTLVVQDLMH